MLLKDFVPEHAKLDGDWTTNKVPKYPSLNRVNGAGGSTDLKISKFALPSLNHHNFSNTEPIHTK